MHNPLEVDSIMVQFRERRILSDVFLKCETGEVVGILGRNGSGKSTLLKVITGDSNSQQKSVRINGQCISNPFKKERIRFLTQHNYIPKSFTVKQDFKHFRNNFRDFIAWFPELKQVYKNQISNISGGERRIIEIYLILASNSLFCLLDEPFSHIMPIHIEQIKKLINRGKANKGIIIVDHMYDHILSESDRLYVILEGKMHRIKTKTDLQMLGYIN